MSELKPCPFCGGEVRLVHRDEEPKNSECEYKDTEECNDCYECGWCDEYWYISHRCKTRYWTFDFDSDFCDTEAEAIEAWNTRAERTCHDVKPSLPYFKCDSCGMEDMGGTELWIQDGFYRSQKPNYCPNCGAKVVE